SSATQNRSDLDNPPSWGAWKRSILNRLHEHFQAESDATDISTAIFGRQAEKGLGLIELLSRRHSVVATNPPYMGSNNMGKVLRDFITRNYSHSKLNLYASFIVRCCELAQPNGYVSIVTQRTFLNN